MIFLIVLFFFVVCLVKSVVLRTCFFHPILTVKYACIDFYMHFKHMKYNLCGTGYIRGYIGLFGKGKTLSAVHFVVGQYLHFNNKKVFCNRRKKFVTQRIKVLSNVALKIPFEYLMSLSQVVCVAENITALDDENDTLTVTIVLADEMSVQMNSRNFKTNIDSFFLNTLLTCRHYNLGMVYTAQRFGHVDALLRQVSSVVINCVKFWRIQCLSFYDAWDMENASSPALLSPISRMGWFIQNKDFEAYDTYACVGNLIKSCAENDMLSEKEILELQQNQSTNMDAVLSPSKKYRKVRKKLK